VHPDPGGREPGRWLGARELETAIPDARPARDRWLRQPDPAQSPGCLLMPAGSGPLWRQPRAATLLPVVLLECGGRVLGRAGRNWRSAGLGHIC